MLGFQIVWICLFLMVIGIHLAGKNGKADLKQIGIVLFSATLLYLAGGLDKIIPFPWE